MKVKMLFSLMVSGAVVWSVSFAGSMATSDSVKAYFETYTQTLTIVFGDADCAARAEVVILPLYEGREWAVSCRWDDNTPTDIRMMKLMDKYGIKGTFYMNGNEQGYWGPKYDYAGPYKEIGRLLVASGNHTIGGHGDRHPSLGYLNRNRLWQEIMRVRVDREAGSDRPVCSYSFSNMNWTNEIEGLNVTMDIAEALFRAGFYHNANSTYLKQSGLEMPAANLLVWDKAREEKINSKFEEYLNDRQVRRSNPNISFSMHAATIDNEFQWAKYAGLFKKWGNKAKWWYCNQNEYAAYRQQFMYSKVETSVEGKEVKVCLTRLVLNDLNDDVPLTFEIRGVAKADVKDIVCGQGKIVEAERGQLYGFNLYHGANQKLPERIGWIANRDNHSEVAKEDVDEDFAFLKGLLYLEGEVLKLELANKSEAALENVQLRWRLPLAWKKGVVCGRCRKIDAGKRHRDSLTLERAHKDFNYDTGVAFYAVQADFECEGKAGRLYLTTQVRSESEDASYPVGRFAFLGPIADEDFSMEMAETAAQGQMKPIKLKGREKVLQWASTAEYADFLHVSALIAEKPAAEHNLKGYYLLMSEVESEQEQRVKLFLPGRRMGIAAVFINGHKAGGETFSLNKGKNRLMIVFGRRGRRAVLFGLASPETGRRLTNISYHNRL